MSKFVKTDRVPTGWPILRAQRAVGIVLTHLWEALELCELTKEAEELHGDAGRDDEQTHREYDEAAQLLAWAKYLVHKIFQHWRCLDETHNSQNLESWHGSM
jgi:hypothetical protein